MDESESKNEKPKEGRRFSQEQYDMLKRCSDKKDITEWNEWRKEHPAEDILLEGARLVSWRLEGALLGINLQKGLTSRVYLDKANFSQANLSSSDLSKAHLVQTRFRDARLEQVKLVEAHLEQADFWNGILSGAEMNNASLSGAKFTMARLEGTSLSNADLKNVSFRQASLRNVNLRTTNLEGTDFWKANLTDVRFDNAHVSNVSFVGADMGQTVLNEVSGERANFKGANLRGSYILLARLKNADFSETDLRDATIYNSQLEGANFYRTHLEHANLSLCCLEGARITGAYLEGTKFGGALVNSSTIVWRCRVDCKTDFRSVNLECIRIPSETKQLLEYNIRRMNWKNWYWGEMKRNHKVFERLETKRESRLRACRVVGRLVLTSPVRVFWWMSDYGLRTWRVIATFFGLATAFGVVYWLCPSCVMVNGVVGGIRGFWHALYFSVVTMTTLGFGDIAANPDSWGGQTLLMLQVILGYVLLGALVTRFAVLFTAGGPAGKFSD